MAYVPEVDCQVLRLPTVAGLSHHQDTWESETNPELWDALAAAVLSSDGFDEDSFERDRQVTLATVVDLAAYRESRN